jgi:hypothetical protein
MAGTVFAGAFFDNTTAEQRLAPIPRHIEGMERVR